MGNTEDKFQAKKQQQLSRSFSLDIPMELRRAHFSLPAINDLRPRERHSLNHPRIKADASNRLSLNTKTRPSSAQHRQVREEEEEERRLTFSTMRIIVVLVILGFVWSSSIDTFVVFHS
jgi:hypothetical protein